MSVPARPAAPREPILDRILHHHRKPGARAPGEHRHAGMGRAITAIRAEARALRARVHRD